MPTSRGTTNTDQPVPGPSARRSRLAELDALTDRIDPLLAHLDEIWRAVERELGWRPS